MFDNYDLTNMMRCTLLLLGLMLTSWAHGQHFCGPAVLQAMQQAHQHDATCLSTLCPGLQGSGVSLHSSVATPPWYVEGPGPRSAIIQVQFDAEFPSDAKPAIERAVDIWAQSIESVVPVQIEAIWDSLSPNVLAQSAPYEVLNNFSGAIVEDRQYAVALANQLAGEDLNPAAPDMVVKFGKDVNWYHGLDGETPDDLYDLVTVALHEMGHGLGYIGSANHNGNSGFLGFQGVAFIYDEFVEESDQDAILEYISGTVPLGDALESDDLFWSGSNGLAANNSGRPRLYAPTNWSAGASFSHLREASFPSGSENALMTPFLNLSEAIHTPGAVSLGMMQDMGWNLPPLLCDISNVALLAQTACNPANSTYTQQVLISYENAPEEGVLVVNGVEFPIISSPQAVSLSGLDSDGMDVDVTAYFSENPDCSWFAPALFTAPEPCCTRLRLDEVNPQSKTLVVRNVSDCSGSLVGQTIKSGTAQVQLSDLAEPATSIAPGGTLTLVWPNWPDNAEGGDLTLYDELGPFDDYVQWRTAGNSGQFLASIYGLWENGTFVDGLPPYTYEGDVEADPAEQGAEFWGSVPFPCAILDMTVGATSACSPLGNVFTQELEFAFQSPPLAGDVILVADSMLAFSGENPWNVVLTLPASGEALDITATVMGDPLCTATFVGEVLSPESCGCPTDLNGGGFVDVSDLLMFLTDYGCLSGCTADFNGDGIVNVSDLLVFLTTYGATCE